MKLNYKEGMFLGKQELERQNAIAACFGDSVSRVVGRTKGSSFSVDGVFNPEKLGLKIEIKTVNNVQGVAVTVSASEFSFSELGRAIVGQKNGSRIGVVSDSDFTGKECFLPLSSLPIGESGYDDTMLVFRLKPATTNYENALITIDSTGQGTFVKGWDFVKNLFREATGGRASTIKTSGNQILKVASVDIVNHRVQFEGTSFTAETAVQFMFVQTLSPFVTDTPQPLYTYDTCEVYCDGVGYGDYESSAFADDGLSIPIATAWIEDDSLGTIQVITLSDFQMNEINMNLFPFLDTVKGNQIRDLHLVDSAVTTPKIANKAVTTPKIEDLAVTRAKLGLNSWGYRGIIQDTRSQDEIIYFEPGQIGFVYNENNPLNDRYLVPRIPSGFTAEMAILQPTRIILEPNVSLNPDAYTELRGYFKTTGTGISLYFPNTMEGVQPGESIYEVFDVFWMSLTKAVVTWSRVNIEW